MGDAAPLPYADSVEQEAIRITLSAATPLDGSVSMRSGASDPADGVPRTFSTAEPVSGSTLEALSPSSSLEMPTRMSTWGPGEAAALRKASGKAPTGPTRHASSGALSAPPKRSATGVTSPNGAMSPPLRQQRYGWSMGKLRDWIARAAHPPVDGKMALNPDSLRPLGLPPKTEKETREHAKKIEELRRHQKRQARKKEEADLRRQRFLAQREEFMQRATEIWKTEVIPNWETQHRLKHVRRMWAQGIPDCVRKDVWPLAIENALRITPELFEIFKAKAEEARRHRPPLSPISSSCSGELVDEEDAMSATEPCRSMDSHATGTPRGMSPTSSGSPVGFGVEDLHPALSAPSAEHVHEVSSTSSGSSTHGNGSHVSTGPSQPSPPMDGEEHHLSCSSTIDPSPDDVPRRLNPSPPDCTGNAEPLSKEGTAALIQLDLRRTFPQLQFYREGPEHDNLYIVLDTYVHYRPDIGYVQGMTYLAGILLLFMDCYTAFVCLVNMLNKYHFLAFFRMEMREMNVHLLTFDMLMRDQLPAVHETFHENGLRVEFFCIDWFVTLYSKSLPLDVAARVWDLFFMDPNYLYIVGLGIIKFYIHKFTNSEFEDMFEFMTHLPKKMDEHAFFQVIASFDIPHARLKAIKQEARRNARDKIG